MGRVRFALLLLLAVPLWAQDQTKLGADFTKEGQSFASCGSLKGIPDCAETLFTGHPLHIAVGSIAPQNGFGAGVAFVAHWTPNESWRLSWDVDAVGSINGSWRGGAYMQAIFTRPKKVVETRGRRSSNPQPNDTEDPVFHLYAQTISLNKIDYFGLGPNSAESARTFYGMRETIPGLNVWWPVYQPSKIELSLFGEINGRIVAIGPSPGQPSPSIEQLYTDSAAPGLSSQPGFVQLGEGIRFKTKPAFLSNRLRLNYFLDYQQFWAPANDRFTFERFTTDLSHQIALHSTTKTYLPRYQNGPDECSENADKPNCPAITKNVDGSINFRFLLSESFMPMGHVVPFYFDPTLGGWDVNGNPSLGSYQDYRFRAPNVLLLSAAFEHSVYGPVGFSLGIDGGKVALTHGDIDFSNLQHSYTAGLTIRAGGFPQFFLLFAWGGNEGTHTIANLNTSLLGGAARPSL